MLIGSLDAADDRFLFTKLADVQVSGDGRIFGLDFREAEIKVFSPAGQYLFKFGRRGSGPGEFGSPFFFHIRDSIVIVPAGIGRVATFDLAGKHRRTYAVPIDSVDKPVFPLRDGWRLQHLRSTSRATVRTGHDKFWDYLVVRAPKSRMVDTVARLWKQGYFELRNGVAGAMNTRFGASGDWALHGDSLVAIVDGYDGFVRWLKVGADGLREIRRESLGVKGEPVSTSDVALEMDTKRQQQVTLSGGGRSEQAAPRLTLLNPPSHWSVATRALFSLEGTLFVRLADKPTGERVWRVFPASGTAFDIAFPRGFTPTAARGDRIYGTEFTTEDGVIAIGVYQVRRP